MTVRSLAASRETKTRAHSIEDAPALRLAFVRHLAIATILLMFPATALSQGQGDVFQSGSGQTLRLEISNDAIDLHHVLSIEIEAERVADEYVWNRSEAQVKKYEPHCFVDYDAAHKLMPKLQQEFLARDYADANNTAKQASTLLAQADACSNDPKTWGTYYVPPTPVPAAKPYNPYDNPYYQPGQGESGPGAEPLPVSQPAKNDWKYSFPQGGAGYFPWTYTDKNSGGLYRLDTKTKPTLSRNRTLVYARARYLRASDPRYYLWVPGIYKN